MSTMLSDVMTREQMLSYINEHPGLSVDQLKDLAGRADISAAVDDVAVTVFSTGRIRTESSGDLAQGLSNQHPGGLGVIDKTEAGKLFADSAFEVALENAILSENPSASPAQLLDEYNKALYGTDGGIWSKSSENLASKVKGDVLVIISPDADFNRIFAQNELPKLLANPDVTTN